MEGERTKEIQELRIGGFIGEGIEEWEKDIKPKIFKILAKFPPETQIIIYLGDGGYYWRILDEEIKREIEMWN